MYLLVRDSLPHRRTLQNYQNNSSSFERTQVLSATCCRHVQAFYDLDLLPPRLKPFVRADFAQRDSHGMPNFEPFRRLAVIPP